ncbi:hypothetical protein SPHINGO8BC_10172 [Sphingobacterium multivorum]|uniref:Uncharacterized protein n=1 Tax=Sphingobacterium multivorum TaxID=28454 RepID=A0A653XX29_SPHMU|nr:hypothetical protein SPHINGO8BC_10172 [Sphingobacterium multivorum]
MQTIFRRGITQYSEKTSVRKAALVSVCLMKIASGYCPLGTKFVTAQKEKNRS